MSRTRSALSRPAFARPVTSIRTLASAMAVAVLITACSGGTDSGPRGADPAAAAASDGGSAASDDGGQTTASVPVENDPIPVTPAPAGFTPPDGGCTGEGAHLVSPGATATPALPTRGDEPLAIGLKSIGKDSTVELTAALGDGGPRPIAPAHVGDTIEIDLWTLSVTSICPDTQQVEFDVIN